jgi:GNAT superfamily N-acetyltransferase
MTEEIDFVSAEFTCVVRPAQPRDCDGMAGLAGQLGYKCSGDEVRKQLSDMQDASDYAVLVAELPGGKIAGWIGAYIFRSIEAGSWPEVNGLVVDENLRSRGIGKRLLDAAEQWAQSIGYDAISVRSNITRDRAHQFYKNNGYEQIKIQREFRKSL